ncbi:Reducing-end xylose-releasing exo-oligoxylanase Rex8A [Mortierella sp. GBA39]|nr:Reducing-end xylose-releasing exo-oligoxylanase Rex8A [Mortierella sp. GBA39]
MQGAFYTGQYRNVFLEAGYSQEEIDARLDQAWNDLFDGAPEVRIYFPLGEDKGYVLDTGNSDVRTEGMSYGMMMAVQMDKKDIFDRLWNFSKSYMQHKEGRYKDYFAWHCKPDGTRLSPGPAPDGEEYYAMALFFASNRWGDGLPPRAYLHLACHPETGLSPEYANYDGTPAEPQPHGDYRHFFSDAYRVAANIALDWEWFRQDPWQVGQSNRIQRFFREIEPSEYRRYRIDGSAFEEPALHPIGLLATNAMASLAADGEDALPFVHKFWSTPLRTGIRRYYDNCLYFFSLLALSGKYRIY